MESSRSTELTYKATRQYVKDKYPELEPYFDNIWNSAISKKKIERKEELRQHVGKEAFVSDDTLLMIAEIVVPFFSVIFSSIIAESVKEKMKASKKKATLEIKVGKNKKWTVEVPVDKKTAQKLLPYAIKQLEAETIRNGEELRKRRVR